MSAFSVVREVRKRLVPVVARGVVDKVSAVLVKVALPGVQDEQPDETADSEESVLALKFEVKSGAARGVVVCCGGGGWEDVIIRMGESVEDVLKQDIKLMMDRSGLYLSWTLLKASGICGKTSQKVDKRIIYARYDGHD